MLDEVKRDGGFDEYCLKKMRDSRRFHSLYIFITKNPIVLFLLGSEAALLIFGFPAAGILTWIITNGAGVLFWKLLLLVPWIIWSVFYFALCDRYETMVNRY